MNGKVLIIDDDAELVSLLSDLLTQQNYQVSAENDGHSGLESALRYTFDVILLDVMLPGMDGFEVLKQLRMKKMTPVIMLTAKGDDYDKVIGLEIGADDYVPKPFNPRELLARVKAMFRRIEHISNHNVDQDLIVNHVQLQQNNHSVISHEKHIELTGAEFQLLQLLMNNAGAIVSKEQISQKVFNRPLLPFDRNIDMHVSNIRKKLSNDKNEKIKTIRGSGYIFLKGE